MNRISVAAITFALLAGAVPAWAHAEKKGSGKDKER